MFLGFDPDEEYLASTARKAIKDEQLDKGYLIIEVSLPRVLLTLAFADIVTRYSGRHTPF